MKKTIKMDFFFPYNRYRKNVIYTKIYKIAILFYHITGTREYSYYICIKK